MNLNLDLKLYYWNGRRKKEQQRKEQTYKKQKQKTKQKNIQTNNNKQTNKISVWAKIGSLSRFVGLRYYDTADLLIYPNSARKPSMWPTGWVCPGLANFFEGGLKPNLLWSSFMVWTEEQIMIFSDQHKFWHEASLGI